MPKTEPDEKAMARVLIAFVTACDEQDWSWCWSWCAFERDPTKEERAVIKALREREYLLFGRGAVDEDGNFVGGSGYGATLKGKLWLAEIEAQQELPL